jgi:hypothetical protein
LAHDKLLESISRKATILVSKCCSFRFHCCNNIPWISAFTCTLSIKVRGWKHRQNLNVTHIITHESVMDWKLLSIGLVWDFS